MKLFVTALGVALTASAGATCPVSECNYLDPQFTADFKRYSDCVGEYTNRLNRALDSLAVLFPRFGIAYRAYSGEIKGAIHPDGTVDQAALDEAKRRFDDRILQTAEPEALEEYNMIQLSGQQHPLKAQCGAAPEPPRKVP
jgi:hypothetical protein